MIKIYLLKCIMLLQHTEQMIVGEVSLLDISCLPGFHYLSYPDTLMAILPLEQENEAKDCFLTPDFFLPIRNIKYLLESKKKIFTEDMESIRNLVGISCENIQMYLDHLKEKEQLKTETENK
ncbi:hypothetical protein CHS0354_007859 [Potamilus streckersoni]|uniref:Uncharacterized protein n=1 Tax=Potamilus streckersoni TaxID=2493646 RepID=A0AAE0VWD5_9BIVA|nr:hypothetical protein CHS0354_007859 [Potamilus streckersoni]